MCESSASASSGLQGRHRRGRADGAQQPADVILGVAGRLALQHRQQPGLEVLAGGRVLCVLTTAWSMGASTFAVHAPVVGFQSFKSLV